ncbi:MAG TPA: glycerol dehydrogenase [Anaerolineaceae bacterium]|nr:glycerol dehydrogenase [Anaerolineaceae bacterium]
MLSTSIFPGRYVQGFGAIQSLGSEASRFGKKALLLLDPFVADELYATFEASLKAALEPHIERFTGEASDEEVERLSGIVRQAGDEVVIGIGGGKTLDTAKAVAHHSRIPVVIVPTIASTDAPTSALSVIYTPRGEFKRYLVLPQNPDLVLVDTKIIAAAPVRFLVSGMGDALATWFEAESARQKHAPNMTGNLGTMTSYALARLCFDTLMAAGLTARTACEAHAVVPALERVVEANILLSGLGFESGGLAAAHAIHNGFTPLEATHAYFHGEKVAFGTLASLFLTGKPTELIDQVYDFCEDVGLPITLADIGLEAATDEQIEAVARAATAEGETIYNEPVPITVEAVAAAIKAADAEGRRRKLFSEEGVLVEAR